MNFNITNMKYFIKICHLLYYYSATIALLNNVISQRFKTLNNEIIIINNVGHKIKLSQENNIVLFSGQLPVESYKIASQSEKIFKIEFNCNLVITTEKHLKYLFV